MKSLTFKHGLIFIKKNYHSINKIVWREGLVEVFNSQDELLATIKSSSEEAAMILYQCYFAPGSTFLEAEKILKDNLFYEFFKDTLYKEESRKKFFKKFFREG